MIEVEIVPLKRVATLNDDKLDESTDAQRPMRYIDIGAVGRGSLVEPPAEVSFADSPSRARRLVAAGDTIVSTVRTYLRAVWPVQDDSPDTLVVSTGFAVVRPRTVDPGFTSWVLQSDPFIEEVVARSVGVSYPAINPNDLASIGVPVPATDHQSRIATFLDCETQRIDQLIALKGRMVAVTAEWANAAVETAVLGLDLVSDPATSEYYAACPKGWSGTLLRHLQCEVQTGPFGSQLHQEDYVEGGLPVVNPANLRGGEIVAIESTTVGEEKLEELSRHQLMPGDIVFGRRGEMGRAGLVTEQQEGWLCGTGSLRLRISDDRLDPGFLKLVLETSAMRRYFSLNSVGSTMENLNSDIVLGMPLVLPSRDAQTEIVESSWATRRVHDDLVSALENQIELLHQRRRSLITAAVTGEMEVA